MEKNKMKYKLELTKTEKTILVDAIRYYKRKFIRDELDYCKKEEPLSESDVEWKSITIEMKDFLTELEDKFVKL